MQKHEISQALKEQYKTFIRYVLELDNKQFVARKNGKWTVGQHLEHLYLCVKPLHLAFSLPHFVLRIIFGKANRPSKTYEELVHKYQERLQKGGKASGKFVPKEVGNEKRQVLAKTLEKAIQKLTEKIEKYTEEDLDGLILPHPLLGKVTFREMLYFTAYHAEHHLHIAKRDLES